MNPLYTAAEEHRVTAAAMAEARHLRALAPAEFWAAAGRWACRMTDRLTRGLIPCMQADAAAHPQAK